MRNPKWKLVIGTLELAALSVSSLFTSVGTLDAQAAEKGFYVNGTSIYDANGNEFIMRGINVAHAWYSSYTESSLKAIADTGANTARIVVSDGQQYTKTTKDELNKIVNWCEENELVCILEVHDATGSDSTSDLNAAVDYWIEMKDVLSGNEDTVILNIANEWYGTWDGSAWANGYQSAISEIRDADISNLLMIDCAGWGQYPDSIKYYGKSVFEADEDCNTVFSIHMYEYAGGDSSTVKTNIDNALSIGVPVVIGEFGAQHTNGDVDEATIMSYCQQKKVGYLGWSWKGNNSDLSYLDISNDWNGGSYTSWGNTLIYGSNGIQATSSKCSVYVSSSDSGSSDNSGSSDSSDSEDPYVSLFWGNATSSPWNQAVSVMTTKNGGSFDAGNLSSNGYFYVEYSGTQDQLEFILQSWSGGASWAKVSPSETGTANGHYYAKYSYDNCVSAFGTNQFSSYLDQIHAGSANSTTTFYSVCYCYHQ